MFQISLKEIIYGMGECNYLTSLRTFPLVQNIWSRQLYSCLLTLQLSFREFFSLSLLESLPLMSVLFFFSSYSVMLYIILSIFISFSQNLQAFNLLLKHPSIHFCPVLKYILVPLPFPANYIYLCFHDNALTPLCLSILLILDKSGCSFNTHILNFCKLELKSSQMIILFTQHSYLRKVSQFWYYLS